VWPVAGKQRDGKIALLAKPVQRAAIRHFSMAAPFVHRRDARKHFVQVMA